MNHRLFLRNGRVGHPAREHLQSDDNSILNCDFPGVVTQCLVAPAEIMPLGGPYFSITEDLLSPT